MEQAVQGACWVPLAPPVPNKELGLPGPNVLMAPGILILHWRSQWHPT